MTRGLSRRGFLGVAAGAANAFASRNPNTPLVSGFIYGGPKNDLGYNQSHAEGKEMLRGLPWIRAVDEANVLETIAAEESMRNMIHQDGASAIFATSFGHFDPFTTHVAQATPA